MVKPCRAFAIIVLVACLSGCSPSDEPTNIAEGVAQSEFEKYEAMVQAEEKANAALAADPAAGT